MIGEIVLQLLRERSRRLSGGSFLLATILNRKDAKTTKGSIILVKV